MKYPYEVHSDTALFSYPVDAVVIRHQGSKGAHVTPFPMTPAERPFMCDTIHPLPQLDIMNPLVKTIDPLATRVTSLEIWMDTCLFGRDSSRGIVFKHCVKKIQTILLKSRNQSSSLFTIPLGERWFEVGERSHTRPIGLVRSA